MAVFNPVDVILASGIQTHRVGGNRPAGKEMGGNRGHLEGVETLSGEKEK